MSALSFFVPPENATGFVAANHLPDEGESLNATLAQATRVWGLLESRALTGEALGWFSLFAKALSTLLALRGALAARSTIALYAAERLVYELHTHIHSILRPVAVSDAALQDSRAQSVVRENLRLYAAWGIANDSKRLNSMLEADTLDDLFEPQTARALISTLGERRAEYERFFGEIPEDSDQELALDRKRYCASLQQQLNELESLATTLALTEAVSRVQAVKKRDGGFASVLLQLAGQESSTVTQQLRDGRIGFARSAYSESSQHLHGSTLAIEADSRRLVPAGFSRAPAIAGRVSQLAVMVRDHLMRLNVLVLLLPEAESSVTRKKDEA